MDQIFDGIAFHFFSPAVDAILQIAARENRPGAYQQGLQQGELAAGQSLRGAAMDACLFGGRIERHHAVAEHRCRRAGLAPQNGAHPGQQLRHLKRLGHIVVGPAVQAAQAIIQAVARRDDEQGDRVASGAQAGQHLQSILAGQAQVQQHQIVVLAAQRRERRLSVLHPIGGIGRIPQRALDRIADHGIVLNQQDPHPPSVQSWFNVPSG